MASNILLAVTAAVSPADNFDSFIILGVVLGVAFLFGLTKVSERRGRQA